MNTDEVLFKLDAGLDMAFDRAKILSKYLGELISYVKKKANLGNTFCVKTIHAIVALMRVQY